MDNLFHQIDKEKSNTENQLCQPANTPVLLRLLHPIPGLRQDVKQGSRQQHTGTEAEQHGVDERLASLQLFSLETKNSPFMKWICLCAGAELAFT